MLREDFFKKILELDTVFSPSMPLKSREVFSGRITQIRKLYEAVIQRGEHAVLYGERGVGKTSLANILPYIYEGNIKRVVKITCSKSDDYKTIWKRALQKITIEYHKPGIGFGDTSKKLNLNLNNYLSNESTITPGVITNILAQIVEQLVIVFDEYDSIINSRVKVQFADTLKELSDNNENVTIVIVGIGNTVIDLIGDHPSLERCLKQVLMPKMSESELREIIDKSLKKLNMTINEKARDLIVEYSFGFPHYTHLLTKFSAKTALQNETFDISRLHFNYAMEEILENVNQSVREAYHKAIVTTKKESKFENVVAACAMALENNQGSFKTLDVVDAYNNITKQNVKRQGVIYNLGKLCQSERGNLLEKVGKGHFKFRNPLIKAYIRLKLFKEGKLY